MKQILMLMLAGSLFLAPRASRADIVASPEIPPQMMMLTGKLSLAQPAQQDHALATGSFLLTLDDGKVVKLGDADRFKASETGERVDPTKLLGQRVAVVLMGRERARGISVISVEKISAAEPAKPAGR